MFYNYIKNLLLLFTIAILLLFIINIYINPYLTYNQYFDNKIVKYSYNEREQKALSIKYNDMELYDTLLIGSSRVTYFNQLHFKKYKVFNFAVSDCLPSEYNDMINYARKHMPNLKNIIIGLDFQTTNVNYLDKPLVNYNKYENIIFLIKRNLSIDTLKYSLKDIFLTIKKDYNSFRVYNNENIVLYKHEKSLSHKLNNRELLKNYIYNNKLKEYLFKIKEDNSDLTIKAFVTPISNYRMKKYFSIIDKDYIDKFDNDIKFALKTNINNFLINQNISNRISKYFMDTHHLTPRGCDILIRELEK